MAIRSEHEKKQQKHNAEKKKAEEEKPLHEQSNELTNVHQNYINYLNYINDNLVETYNKKKNSHSLAYPQEVQRITQRHILLELVSIRTVLEKIESKLDKK